MGTVVTKPMTDDEKIEVWEMVPDMEHNFAINFIISRSRSSDGLGFFEDEEFQGGVFFINSSQLVMGFSPTFEWRPHWPLIAKWCHEKNLTFEVVKDEQLMEICLQLGAEKVTTFRGETVVFEKAKTELALII